jgi:hypothetical protein
MEYLIAYPIIFVYLSVLWVAVLVVYNMIFEPFDFGALGPFAAKSAILIAIMSAISLIPFVYFFSLIFWWIGLMIVFKKDFWECRILVFLIWGLSIVFRFALGAML